jgi:molybdopterin molybdotransferase
MSGVPPESASILNLQDARRVVEEQARALTSTPAEAIDLLPSRGRVLAEDLLADRDFPPFPRATRDGYAVRAADLSQVPRSLRIVGEVRAGSPIGEIRIPPAQAAEIMTGAPVPEGADAVVMVEYTRRQGDAVEIQRGVAPGENVVPAASESRAGQVLVRAGTRMDYAAVAVAAAVGKSQVRVHRRPRVAVISTGDEIVDIAATPAPHQIRNSNAYSLAAQVEAAGGEPVAFPIAADTKDVLRRVIADGLALDLLLLTGGVSMGKYDLVEQVLAQFGAQFFFTGALIQPGRPVVFGRAPSPAHPGFTPFFGLPGNPVSTMVTFEIFARSVLNALSGAEPGVLRFLHARLKSEVRAKPGLTRFLPAVLSGEFEDAKVELVPWQGSGDLASVARANCYLVVPPDRPVIPAGEMVAVLPRGL